jgi:hypothetical protein
MKILNLIGLVAMTLASATVMSAQAPTADTLKQVLNQRLQKLRPDGYTERNVLFEDVRAGKGSGDYPFQVTAIIRDYGPGYPANRFYGDTCVGRMDKRVFRMSRDEFGQWSVEGAMTVTSSEGRQCKPNPSAGVSSIPLSSLQGTAAPAGTPPPAPATPAASGGSSALPAGEYACYGSGGTLLIGLGFRNLGNGKYTDLDRKSTGTYTVQGGTITFRGGHLDGQTGRNLHGNKFVLGSMVSCEPYH